MKSKRWLFWDRWMRDLHLYTGLFLVPWMTVYAVSAFSLNHREWFTEGLDLAPDWKNVSEVDFTPGPEFPRIPRSRPWPSSGTSTWTAPIASWEAPTQTN